jgi:hypothetical protein
MSPEEIRSELGRLTRASPHRYRSGGGLPLPVGFECAFCRTPIVVCIVFDRTVKSGPIEPLLKATCAEHVYYWSLCMVSRRPTEEHALTLKEELTNASKAA